MNLLPRQNQVQTIPQTQALAEYRLGFQAYLLGDKQAALQHFQSATHKQPALLEAQRWLGRVALELGLGDEAQRAFESVIALQGQTAAVLRSLEFARAVSRYGLEAAEHFRVGYEQHQNGKYDPTSFEAAVTANPLHQPAWAWLGRVQLEARDYDAAALACQQAVMLDPDDAGSASRLQMASRYAKPVIPTLAQGDQNLPVTTGKL